MLYSHKSDDKCDHSKSCRKINLTKTNIPCSVIAQPSIFFTKMSEENASSVDVVPNDQPQAEIFRLKMDHFEELFDWLSLEDLTALGETCKRMQSIASFYVKTNYAAIYPEFEEDGIHLLRNYSIPDRIKLDALCSFLKRIEFSGDLTKEENKIEMLKSYEFKSLTEVQLTRVLFTEAGILFTKKLLGQLETVKMRCTFFLGEDQQDDYEQESKDLDTFLQCCPNVKKLCIDGIKGTSFVGTDNSWLLRKYPALEHFELTKPRVYDLDDDDLNELQIRELRTFFQ